MTWRRRGRNGSDVVRDELRIDGREGEGGGQVLRSSLALAVITGRSIRLEGIRGGRKKPGLMRQHLTCVQAAARVGAAEVEGAALGSQELVFRPQGRGGGHHELAIGGAGSTSLVLQAILPALLRADAPSSVRISGGTHNPMAPCFDFLDRVFFPRLRAMGVEIEGRLRRHGFFPAGGGRIEVEVRPAATLIPFELLRRGEIATRRARVLTARLPGAVGPREAEELRARLGWNVAEIEVVEIEDSLGPGNVIVAEAFDADGIGDLVTAYGEKGLRAELVARDAARQMKRYLHAEVPVGRHLADQLLIPMALAGAGAFRCRQPTLHTTTNAALIERFLPVRFRFEEESSGATTVSVGPA